jgi:hypothetical protein
MNFIGGVLAIGAFIGICIVFPPFSLVGVYFVGMVLIESSKGPMRLR